MKTENQSIKYFKIITEKHPLAVRIFHWFNFFVLSIMVWSGLLIYWANDVYKIGWNDFSMFDFFPEPFYRSLGISHKLAKGMSFHFTFMWFFALNGLLYVIFLFYSGEYKSLLPKASSWREAWLVFLHDLHLIREMPPQNKYNAAQRIAYTAVILMGIFIILSGLAIYKPIQFHMLCSLLGGYELARMEHFILTILFSLFFFVHIVQVILAGWNNFRGMVAGFEVEKKEVGNGNARTPAKTETITGPDK